MISDCSIFEFVPNNTEAQVTIRSMLEGNDLILSSQRNLVLELDDASPQTASRASRTAAACGFDRKIPESLDQICDSQEQLEAMCIDCPAISLMTQSRDVRKSETKFCERISAQNASGDTSIQSRRQWAPHDLVS